MASVYAIPNSQHIQGVYCIIAIIWCRFTFRGIEADLYLIAGINKSTATCGMQMAVTSPFSIHGL